jgi:hypothetical protein
VKYLPNLEMTTSHEVPDLIAVKQSRDLIIPLSPFSGE